MKKYLKNGQEVLDTLKQGHTIFADDWVDGHLLMVDDKILDEDGDEFSEEEITRWLGSDHCYIYADDIEELNLVKTEWYYKGVADYVITKKGEKYFLSIDDLEEIPFEEIESLVKTVKDLK
jgi:hypothetical protein